MRVYYQFAKNTFQTLITYRLQTFLSFVSSVMAIFVQISIWTALYRGNVAAGGTVDAVSLSDMLTYVILSTVVSVFTQSRVIYTISSRVRTGEIAMDLIKPISFFKYVFSLNTGQNAFGAVFRALPLILIFVPLYRISVPDAGHFIVFVLSIFNAMLIRYLITYALGLTGFWAVKIWHLEFLFSIMMEIFAGSVVPLWFFPAFFVRVSDFLPFKFIHFVPLSIYLQKLTLWESLLSLIYQLLWIGALFALSRLIWARGVKKLVLQGG